MKNKILILIISTAMLAVAPFFTNPTKSQANPECMGAALAEYMNAIIAATGSLPNVRLLSPAFNMSHPDSPAVVTAMTANGANWGGLYGIAGNAYNVAGRRTTDWVEEHVAHIPISKPVMVTETGKISGSLDDLREELSFIQSGSHDGVSYLGAELFNAFNTGFGWGSFGMSDADITYSCSGSCGNIGVNSAAGFAQPDSFYGHAQSLGMGHTLEIYTGFDATLDGVNKAHVRDMLPIVRVGVGSDGPSLAEYISVIQGISATVSQPVYFIAGPNEPEMECWLAPECCDAAVLPPGGSRRPVPEGFYVEANYTCSQVANPEFHPIRPYPANSCDPLILLSTPEATAPTSVLKRYNTYACGSDLEFYTYELFDPYAEIDASAWVRSRVQPNTVYAKTVCYDETGASCGDDCGCPVDGVCPAITCFRTAHYLVRANFMDMRISYLGNTQNMSLRDEDKVNNYLGWYFTGTPQIGDHQELDGNSPEDMDRLINFTGPARKMLPLNFQHLHELIIGSHDPGEEDTDIRTEVARTRGDDGRPPDYVHDYLITDNRRIRDLVRYRDINETPNIFGHRNTSGWLYENAPLSSLEDTPGEAYFTVWDWSFAQPAQPSLVARHPETGIPLTTTPPGWLYIYEALPAAPGVEPGFTY